MNIKVCWVFLALAVSSSCNEQEFDIGDLKIATNTPVVTNLPNVSLTQSWLKTELIR